jgi:Mlc titration factor MtfA (ptsG expression regulator)
MKIIVEDIKYKKGGNEGSISYFQNEEKPFLAVTATKSNWYKTLKGAEKFMEKNGYTKLEKEKEFKCTLWAAKTEVDYFTVVSESKVKAFDLAKERFMKAYPTLPKFFISIEEI